MGFFSRLFGKCRTKPPADTGCWSLANGQVIIDLERAPELGQNNGAIRLEGDGLPMRVMVFWGDDGGIHAIQNKCTHGGRRIDPQPGRSTVQCCSVGKSTFDYDGHRLSGAAKKPITVLPVAREELKVIIDLGEGK